MSSERRSAAERASVLRTIAEVGRAAAERVLEKARTLLAIKGAEPNSRVLTGHATSGAHGWERLEGGREERWKEEAQ
ncbi:MAG: hypothetical protein HYS69_10080 [candidate division NC10 bacterium]|nr:hypothetical protein [candidate division NC10 bacterium]